MDNELIELIGAARDAYCFLCEVIPGADQRRRLEKAIAACDKALSSPSVPALRNAVQLWDAYQELRKAASRLAIYVEAHELIGPDSNGQGDLKSLFRCLAAVAAAEEPAAFSLTPAPPLR